MLWSCDISVATNSERGKAPERLTGFFVRKPNLRLISVSNFREGAKMEFMKELWEFLRVRKKLWLAPIIIVMVILGGLLILAQGSVFAPFIYTLF